MAALFLITPGFVTDTLGFLLLIPLTRKVIINFFLRKNKVSGNKNEDFLEGEISEKKDKDEL